MKLLNFQSQNVIVDWISFNIDGLPNVRVIAEGLSTYFNPHVAIDGKPDTGFHNFKNPYKVSIRQHTGSKSYWIGTQIIFSGKNAAYCYNLIQTQKFDWKILIVDQCKLSLGRIDLYFSRTNNFSDTVKSFDSFLVDSRTKIQNYTTTRHIKLQDFPDGKVLKVNRRNNSLHYRVYQKHLSVRFELEFKHRQTKLVQNYLFTNQLEIFEHKLVLQYFKYSGQVLDLDYPYTDWVTDFQRRYRLINNYNQSLVTSYLENRRLCEEDEAQLFHLLQFLSFIKSLGLNIVKDCKTLRVKKQNYYHLKFPLSNFVRYTGIQISNQSGRKKLISYFKRLHQLDPILEEFSDQAFRSYACVLYSECSNPSGKSWVVETYVAEDLLWFSYPFNLPKSFLISKQKNDLRLKILFIKALAVKNRKKILDLQEFFNAINVSNKRLVAIKVSIIYLLEELVKDSVIHNKIEILFKNNKVKEVSVESLTVSSITRRIRYLKFTENIKARI